MAEQLNSEQAAGNQSTTQTPQATGLANGGGTPISAIQPELSSTLQGGAPLASTALSTISFKTPPTTTTASVTTTVPKPLPHHQVNTALFILPIALLVVAGVMFWTTTRSVKNTTKR